MGRPAVVTVGRLARDAPTASRIRAGRGGGAVRYAISRREFLGTVGAGGLVLINPFQAAASKTQRRNVLLLWNNAFLQGVRDSKLGPPMVSRALAIGHTCIFDAWSAYDHLAVGTRLGGALRRPPRERTLANISTAISYAAYRAAVDQFPGDRLTVFDPLMRRLGYDPTN